MITSKQNPKIKRVRALQAQRRARQAENVFVVEGVRLVEEAHASGWRAELVLHTPDLSARGQAAVEAFRALGVETEAVSESVMKAASDTQAPQGILAVLSRKDLAVPDSLDFLLLADGLSDPGNLGTLLRTAAAAGVQAVLLPPGATDPFAPKVIRAGMGAHFRLPVIQLTWEAIQDKLSGLEVFLAAAEGEQAYDQADFRTPLALIIGSEAHGPSPQARRLASSQVYIPMPGGGESLNAAAAASILIFEVVRQRSKHQG